MKIAAHALGWARMKQEQHGLRRILLRIQTIRETSFISSGYVIAEVTTALLAIGLILADIQPFYESLFIVGLIIFLLTFLIMLIRDLDNPFGYYEESSAEDVSLNPLEDFLTRMQGLVAEDDLRVDERRRERTAVLQQTL
jgi:ABC-type multidrug transport system fused ATPase/permease subunit